MNISRPFIDRPIATTLLAVALLLAGALGYQALPVASLPSVAFPTLLVTTRLPGASPATMSELITAPLERQLGDIAGLSAMSSVSSLGTSAITLRFKLTKSLDSAAQGVQAAINAAAATLPPNLPYPPIYTKVNPADAPILTLALTSRTEPLYALANATDTLLQPRLSEISGVGQVTVEGDMKRPNGFISTRHGLPPTASRSRTSARPLATPTKMVPKASWRAALRPFLLVPTIS